MSIKHIFKILLVGLTVFSTSIAGCSEVSEKPKTNPTIRVGIGMTLDELQAGSTYPFKQEVVSLSSRSDSNGQNTNSKNLTNWTITKPYDLAFIFKEAALTQKEMGDWSDTVIISTDSRSNRVNSIFLKNDRRLLDRDNTVLIAKKINQWLVTQGFVPPNIPLDKKLYEPPFSFQKQKEDNFPPLGYTYMDYGWPFDICPKIEGCSLLWDLRDQKGPFRVFVLEKDGQYAILEIRTQINPKEPANRYGTPNKLHILKLAIISIE